LGLDGLRESSRSGAKRKLPADQEIKFKEAVITLQEERVGGRITGHDIIVTVQVNLNDLSIIT
jgi:hypothetical protein